MEPIVYDPAKSYRWKPEDLFTVNGQEFGMIFNTLIAKRKELLRDLDILNILESKLRAAVEAGTAIELSPPVEVV